MNGGRYLGLRPGPRRGLPGAFFVAALVTSVLAFAPAMANAQPELGWVSFEEVAVPEGGPRSFMKDETTTGMMVNFDIPGMFVHEVEVGGEKFHRLSIPGRGTLTDVGKPELPIVGEAVEIPYGVDVDVEVVKSEYVTLEEYVVFPAQKPVPRQETAEREFVRDTAFYQTDAYYPRELAEVKAEDIAVIR